jgi:hypothetical protein
MPNKKHGLIKTRADRGYLINSQKGLATVFIVTMKLLAFIKYTRSPQAKYIVRLEKPCAATRWVTENGKSINIYATHIIGAIELKST